MPKEFDPRHLVVRVAEIGVVIALVALAISALPGLGQLRSHLEHADPGWVAAAAAAEVGSCAGYVLVFRFTFCARMAWGLSSEIALAEQAANSLLPAGGAGGLALGAWALHQAGMPTNHIGRRTVAFFVVTSAANFLGVILAGIATFSGALPGSRSVLFALIPALLALLATLLVAVSPHLLRRLGSPQPTEDRGRGHRIAERVRGLLTGVADGVDQALALLHAGSFGVVVGSFSYMAFDLAALGCGFAATSHLPAIGTLLLGYLVGQLGNLIPIPGGVGGTEAGLVGMFAIYGVDVSHAAAAVVVYRLFELAVPAILGLPAFVLLRRRLLRADHPAAICAPLAFEPVELVARQ